MQHEIEQFIKRVQHEKKFHMKTRKKNCNMEMEQYEKMQHEKSATRKTCNIKKFKLPQWSTEKVHKNTALYSTNG